MQPEPNVNGTAQVSKPYHALFNDKSLAAMKEVADKYEEEAAQRKLVELEAPALTTTHIEDTHMEDLLDAEADCEVEEVENFGDVDEDGDNV